MKSIIVFLLCGLCMSFSTSVWAYKYVTPSGVRGTHQSCFLKTDYSKSFISCKYPVEKTEVAVVKEEVKQRSISDADYPYSYSRVVHSKNDDLLSLFMVGGCLNIQNFKPVVCKLWPYKVDKRSWLRLITPSKKI